MAADLELQLQLQRLAAEVEWPPTPTFDLRARTRRRWPLVVAVSAALALGLAFAVPQSRGSLLRFFHLGAARVERVDTLPPAEERALRDALGVRIEPSAAAAILGQPFAVGGVAVFGSGRAISAIVEQSPPVMLTELPTGGGFAVVKKLASGATAVQWVTVAPHVQGLWIDGGRHVFVAPALPPRYAGNTLLWQDGSVTFRLEGRALTREHALAVARTLLQG
jgi:hypothetical protein